MHAAKSALDHKSDLARLFLVGLLHNVGNDTLLTEHTYTQVGVKKLVRI